MAPPLFPVYVTRYTHSYVIETVEEYEYKMCNALFFGSVTSGLDAGFCLV